eukprot:scaffold60387_cov32-Attheya_sp.AAC.1
MPARVPIAMEEDGINALLPRNSAIAISFFYVYGDESPDGATELNVRYGRYPTVAYRTLQHSPAIGGEDDVSNMSNGELGITSTREMYRRGGGH